MAVNFLFYRTDSGQGGFKRVDGNIKVGLGGFANKFGVVGLR
jgi:hypothetical protein